MLQKPKSYLKQVDDITKQKKIIKNVEVLQKIIGIKAFPP